MNVYEKLAYKTLSISPVLSMYYIHCDDFHAFIHHIIYSEKL